MALPFLPGQVFDRKVGNVGSDSNSINATFGRETFLNRLFLSIDWENKISQVTSI